jgi:hypothetical protein
MGAFGRHECLQVHEVLANATDEGAVVPIITLDESNVEAHLGWLIRVYKSPLVFFSIFVQVVSQ